MVKLTKRKGFNFFRSYYDVYNELEKNEDKVAFIDALLDRQFLGVKPENLKGMAKFAYISQTNSIDSQVKGYEDKTKCKLTNVEQVNTPSVGGSVGGVNTPTLQEEVEEEVEEKVQYVNKVDTLDFNKLLSFIKTQTSRDFRTINKNVKAKFKARLKDGYTKKDIENSIKYACNMSYHKDNGYQYLTPEFFSRADTLDKYGSKSTDKIKFNPNSQPAN